MISLKRVASAALFCALATSANAADFNFSFSDDPTANIAFLAGRAHVAGTVTGIIEGLSEGTSLPTGIEILSGANLVGVTGTEFHAFLTVGPGFTVTAGQITDADLLWDFNDGVGNSYQFRFA